MPPPNDVRRRALADAAIELLCEGGVHAVTHRAVERRAGLPDGTASNYFRSREALLVAATERVGQLHHADMDTIAGGHQPDDPRDTRTRATELIGESLLLATTTYRSRYLAIFELQMESLRRPALAEALTGLHRRTLAFTTGHHAAHGLDIPPEAVPALLALYGGVLFTLVTSPPEAITQILAYDLAAAIVRGALG